MLSTLLSALPSAGILLWTSYGAPYSESLMRAVRHLPPSAAAHPNLVERVVEYTILPSAARGMVEETVRVTMDGRCYVGLETVGCAEVDIGTWARHLIPLLSSYRIYYGLLTYSLLLGVAYQLLAAKGWCTAPELGRLRAFTLGTMILMDFAGVGAVLASLALVILPLFDSSVDTIIDVQLGWALVLTVLSVVFGLMITAGYENWSRRLQQEAERGISLHDELDDKMDQGV